MGVEPITTTVVLGIVAVGALAAYLEECDRESERRRRCEENSSRWQRQQEKEARRREREEETRRREREKEARIREREEEVRRRIREMENEREEQERLFNIRREREERNERIREYELRNRIREYYYSIESTSEYSEYPSSSFYSREINSNNFNSCRCSSCSREREQTRYETFCDCSSCKPVTFNPFETRKNSITVTFTPPQITQDKNKNAKAKSNNRSSSNNRGATTSNSSSTASTPKTSSAPKTKPEAPGSQQPERNNNNNNNSNNDHKKDAIEDYGNLNDFIKKLKAVLDRCSASPKLREQILALFKKFEKHEENFIRILLQIKGQGIEIEDVLLIVIKLFQSDYFAGDVAYENLIALMEIVAKYIKDELMKEMVDEGLRGNELPFEKLREYCMKKVLERNNILTELTDLFKEARKDIEDDNSKNPLDIDFSGIFTKVYHYLKHKVARGKELTVTEYFDWMRKLLALCKDLSPEYDELTNINHPRREIRLEVYSTDFWGRFRLVIRAHGPRLRICTFHLIERHDKKATDGDQYVDGKKKAKKDEESRD